MANVDLTAQRLRELLDYNSISGTFVWRRSTGRCPALSVAGRIHPRGYVMIRVDGVQHLAHRLAWLHQVGSWPTGVIDHIDGVKHNNALTNLRDVSRSENQQNQIRAPRNSPCGLLGVAKAKFKWKAQIFLNGKQKYLGTFDTPGAAHQAYLEAKRLLHSGCTI